MSSISDAALNQIPPHPPFPLIFCIQVRSTQTMNSFPATTGKLTGRGSSLISLSLQRKCQAAGRQAGNTTTDQSRLLAQGQGPGSSMLDAWDRHMKWMIPRRPLFGPNGGRGREGHSCLRLQGHGAFPRARPLWDWRTARGRVHSQTPQYLGTVTLY